MQPAAYEVLSADDAGRQEVPYRSDFLTDWQRQTFIRLTRENGRASGSDARFSQRDGTDERQRKSGTAADG